MTGVFLRMAIAELVFVTTFVLLYTDLGTTGPMLVVALLVSIVLVWVFAAPTPAPNREPPESAGTPWRSR